MAEAREKGVLIVEDDEDLRCLFAVLLEMENFKVFQASDGPGGMSVLRENPDGIDVVITDLSMPNMGGMELIARVKAASPSTKIIATSGLSGEEVRKMVMAAGATKFVPKPFAVQEVIGMVRAMVMHTT